MKNIIEKKDYRKKILLISSIDNLAFFICIFIFMFITTKNITINNVTCFTNYLSKKTCLY